MAALCPLPLLTSKKLDVLDARAGFSLNCCSEIPAGQFVRLRDNGKPD